MKVIRKTWMLQDTRTTGGSTCLRGLRKCELCVCALMAVPGSARPAVVSSAWQQLFKGPHSRLAMQSPWQVVPAGSARRLDGDSLFMFGSDHNMRRRSVILRFCKHQRPVLLLCTLSAPQLIIRLNPDYTWSSQSRISNYSSLSAGVSFIFNGVLLRLTITATHPPLPPATTGSNISPTNRTSAVNESISHHLRCHRFSERLPKGFLCSSCTSGLDRQLQRTKRSLYSCK